MANQYARMLVKISSSGASLFKIEEADAVFATAGYAAGGEGSATMGTAGSSLSCFNRDRNSSDTSGFTATHASLGEGFVTQDASWSTSTGVTAIMAKRFGGNKQGVETRRDDEIVLKQNTEYLFTLESDAASNNISLVLDWYEREDLG